MILTRDVPIIVEQSALLFIDVQNFAAHRNGKEFDGLPEDTFNEKYGWFFDQLDSRVIPNMQALQNSCREHQIEIIYTTIESLTIDGRDRSLDYKITGFNVPKGSWDGKVIDQIAPVGDEILAAQIFIFCLCFNQYRLHSPQPWRTATYHLRINHRSMC